MLSKKQLEDAAKCEDIFCTECALTDNHHDQCYCVAQGAQTALAYRAMLERLEWCRRSMFLANGEFENHCPMCGRHKQDGHSSDCELAALLKESEVEG